MHSFKVGNAEWNQFCLKNILWTEKMQADLTFDIRGVHSASSFNRKALTIVFRRIYHLCNDHPFGTHLFSSCCDVAVSEILETHQDR